MVYAAKFRFHSGSPVLATWQSCGRASCMMAAMKCRPGEHAAILAPGTWERVQSLITHALQRQSGCTVMVIDKSEQPYKEYTINGNGKPIRL